MIRIIKKKVEVSALGKPICMSAHKARRVSDQIRGRSYEEALMILELMPYRACYPINKSKSKWYSQSGFQRSEFIHY
uniref:50S ribosomal protein L22, chloroplastic n=1 Tax=Myrtopsis sp. Munzinger 3458 TaxID=3002497 RepID=A0AA49I1X1_9ROSI|nr:ribosomal protein L22 [Myrtopsis sp. Munzinger 3458]WAJ52049.1 ribosomal protein L22 [Myrtopsis sp. Munzinger 3458]